MPYPEGFPAVEELTEEAIEEAIDVAAGYQYPTDLVDEVAATYLQANSINNIDHIVMTAQSTGSLSMSDFSVRLHLPSDAVWEALLEALKDPEQLEALRGLLNIAKPLPEPTEPNRRVIDL